MIAASLIARSDPRSHLIRSHPIQLYRIHRGKTVDKYHLAVFYMALIEALLLFFHWVYFGCVWRLFRILSPR